MNSLFTQQELDNIDGNLFAEREQSDPVTCLGMEFESDEARREYFRAELRKKLPELRHIEGFPIGEDDDIIALSDPPYYTACPNPWLNDFIAQWEAEKADLEARGLRTPDFEVKEPYAADVSEGKNNPIYMAHAYHTKVPHPAIMRYIYHYTQPGDIIFDGFAGTGMTGVAAGKCSEQTMGHGIKGIRHCICNDLSPIASFITYNFNNPVNPTVIQNEINKLLTEVEKECTSLYKTKHVNGEFGTISYVIWSEIFTCKQCGEEIIYFNEILDKDGNLKERIICPTCGVETTKSGLDKTFITSTDVKGVVKKIPKLAPALIKYEYKGKKYTKRPDTEDLTLLDEIEKFIIDFPIPYFQIPNGVKTAELLNIGRDNVCDLYTRRNLIVFAKLWNRAKDKPLLRFMMTSVLVKTGSLLHNVGFKNGKINLAGALPNALFVPSILAERNVFELLRGKINDIIKIDLSNLHQICNQIQSATDLRNIPDSSVDYIFTDPPFGSNLMYSELNFIHEAWLGVRTDNADEAIENKSQNKNLFSYQDIMSKSFSEFYRILKPGRWMTVEFSNTSASVWNSIQNALGKAGFSISIVRGLDKQQGSFNAQTTTTAVKQDLVISCYKPTSELIEKFETRSSDNNVWDFIEEHLSFLPVHTKTNNKTTAIIERSPKILFDRLISYYVQRGYIVPLNAQDFQKGLRDRFIELDGMFFTAPQAAEYKEKKREAPEMLPMGLIVSDEANGIEWLKLELKTPQTYQEIQPKWLQAVGAVRKNDIIPELRQLLEENFIEEPNGKWRLPNIQDDKDVAALRTKALMREFKLYVEAASKPKGKIKEARVEALRAGFKQCYIDKDFKTIVMVGDRIPANLRDEDEVLLQFYDIALNKI